VHMKRTMTAALVAGLFTLGAFAAPGAAGASERHHHHHHHLAAQLAALRIATARFHSLDATMRSGRTDLHLCMDHMGEHFANQDTFADGKLDPRDPEAMVYEHTSHGLRLVAVEWVSTTPGTVLGIPLHFNADVQLWILHAWIWKFNPTGLFQDTNPLVGLCPAM
jgi:hypothetical protein